MFHIVFLPFVRVYTGLMKQSLHQVTMNYALNGKNSISFFVFSTQINPGTIVPREDERDAARIKETWKLKVQSYGSKSVAKKRRANWSGLPFDDKHMKPQISITPGTRDEKSSRYQETMLLLVTIMEHRIINARGWVYGLTISLHRALQDDDGKLLEENSTDCFMKLKSNKPVGLNSNVDGGLPYLYARGG